MITTAAQESKPKNENSYEKVQNVVTDCSAILYCPDTLGNRLANWTAPDRTGPDEHGAANSGRNKAQVAASWTARTDNHAYNEVFLNHHWIRVDSVVNTGCFVGDKLFVKVYSASEWNMLGV